MSHIGEKSSVQVAVRIRPLNARETSTNLITEIKNKTIYLTNPEDNMKKNFSFDFTYANDTDQETIYNDIGVNVVRNAFAGYNCCVFAYGQSGAGKTHTMMGSEDNLGLIPRICRALYEQQGGEYNENQPNNQSNENQPNNQTKKYKIEMSYLEIYSEEVRDLLSKENTELKIRQHPKYGIYIEGLTQCLVESYQSINSLLSSGNKERIVACTQLNSRSSRSHAILTIYFTQVITDEFSTREIVSKINLVDLAGSEKTNSSGVVGINFKEAVNINQSLTTLGIVIGKLASNSAKTNNMDHVPFRDSVLTWILKESLGGNSKTYMIANISPSSMNYNESLGTLRYANNAKKIINCVSVNEDPNEKIIKVLKDEIENLKRQLLQKSEDQADPQIIKVLKDEIQQREDLMKEKEKSWVDKLNESNALQEQLLAKQQETHTTLQESHTKLTEDYTTLQESHTKLTEDYTTLQESHTTLQESHTTLQEFHTTLQESHTTLQESHTKLTEDYTKLQESHTKLTEDYTKLQETHTTLTNTLTSQYELKQKDYEITRLASVVLALEEQYNKRLESKYTHMENEYNKRLEEQNNNNKLQYQKKSDILLAEQTEILQTTNLQITTMQKKNTTLQEQIYILTRQIHQLQIALTTNSQY